MKENRMKDVLDSIVQRDIPTTVNLWPHIVEKVERRNGVMQMFYRRPALALFLVLLALALLSSVAYAIGKAAGYIPGIGLFDQGAPLRVLAEAVTVTRDGIMLTVEQVVLSSDKTVVIYKVEGIPEDAYESEAADQNVSSISETNENTTSFSSSIVVPLDGTPGTATVSVDSANTCFSDENLLLPDGTLLPLQSGEGSGWVSGFEHRHVFGPGPMEVNEVSFL